MNTKLLVKTIFIIAVLLLLVLMGMNNPKPVEILLPPILKKAQRLPAAEMYFGFFAVGVICGTVLTAGGGKKGGSSSSRPKGDK